MKTWVFIGVSVVIILFCACCTSTRIAEQEHAGASTGVESGRLYITCDNVYTVWLNGEEVGMDAYWEDLEVYAIKLRDGDILAIQCIDCERGKQSGGLYCCIVLDDDKRWLAVDTNWWASAEKPPKQWQTTKDKFVKRAKLSTENVYGGLSDERYKRLNPDLHGEFVWTAEPSMFIYFKRVIDLDDFREQSGLN